MMGLHRESDRDRERHQKVLNLAGDLKVNTSCNIIILLPFRNYVSSSFETSRQKSDSSSTSTIRHFVSCVIITTPLLLKIALIMN